MCLSAFHCSPSPSPGTGSSESAVAATESLDNETQLPIDFFIVDNSGALVLFKATGPGRRFIKATELEALRDRLPIEVRGMEKWRLVFVIPEDGMTNFEVGGGQRGVGGDARRVCYCVVSFVAEAK